MSSFPLTCGWPQALEEKDDMLMATHTSGEGPRMCQKKKTKNTCKMWFLNKISINWYIDYLQLLKMWSFCYDHSNARSLVTKMESLRGSALFVWPKNFFNFFFPVSYHVMLIHVIH